MTDTCGNLYKIPTPMIVERAVQRIMESVFPRAVCVEPRGMVIVESPKTANDRELIGVYTAEMSRKELAVELYGAIAEEMADRVRKGR